MRKNQDHFLPDCYYHIFSRTNNKERLFKQPKNYEYFLKKYDLNLSDYIDTYAYCLLMNHIHLLVKVKSEDSLSAKMLDGDFKSHHAMISKQFATFFGTYAKAINKQENRYGNLFQRPYKRKQIKNESHLSHLIYYIHANPTLHTPRIDFKQYKWSSYQTIISNAKTKVARQELLEWFGGLEHFVSFHDRDHNFKMDSKFE